MKIARNVAVSGRLDEWYGPFPAPSLRELSRPTGVTEGVSSVGCSMPMVYQPAHIGSEIFERVRSSGYTPSVSHSLDSSLREGAGNGGFHSTGYSLNRGVSGDFHRPYEALRILDFTIQRNTREILRFIAYCAVRRADRAQMWAAASLGMCWRWDWRIWASWAGLSSRDRAFSSSPRRRTAGTAMEVST